MSHILGDDTNTYENVYIKYHIQTHFIINYELHLLQFLYMDFFVTVCL